MAWRWAFYTTRGVCTEVCSSTTGYPLGPLLLFTVHFKISFVLFDVFTSLRSHIFPLLGLLGLHLDCVLFELFGTPLGLYYRSQCTLRLYLCSLTFLPHCGPTSSFFWDFWDSIWIVLYLNYLAPFTSTKLLFDFFTYYGPTSSLFWDFWDLIWIVLYLNFLALFTLTKLFGFTCFSCLWCSSFNLIIVYD